MSESRFRVYWLPDARKIAKELAVKARQIGLVEAFKLALSELNERLESEPLAVGELYRSRGSVAEHVAAHKLLGIDFGVDTDKKIVAVRKCWALPKGGLQEDE